MSQVQRFGPLPGSAQRDSSKVVKKTPDSFEESDVDTLIRMLYYCSDEPKVTSQIISYCSIDRKQILRFLTHCSAQGLLKVASYNDGLLYLLTTEHGKEVLATAQNVMRGLGIELKTANQTINGIGK